MDQVTSLDESPVLCFFEKLQSAFLDEFEKDVAALSISLKKRPSQFHFSSDEKTLAFENGTVQKLVTYSWPGKSPHEAWKFSCVLRVLSLIFEAVQDNLLVSKRSIYYDNPDLFGTQRVVDSIVDDIAYTIGVDRAALHVTSVGKGLTAGVGRFTTKSEFSFDTSTGDVLIPRLADIESIDISEVKLVHNRYSSRKGILITGKGYPDICTREFVHLLSDIASRERSSVFPDIRTALPPSSPRFFALVDGDPDGLAIMSTYKYGSMAHAHESARLNAPKLEWLGTRISDIVGEKNKLDSDDWVTISLTPRDSKKIQKMLSNNPVFTEDGPQPDWRAELQTMMLLNMKVETEVLYGAEGGLEKWMDAQMVSM
ncbi:meiotic recombination protein SPO11 [Talaromyces islandicus]|uniref:DNA topoisomerase (ATP-hydrolyzing) n=1 Tax=Talaromyces islandicus TaxID=28573 RepID=A0A0U1LV65_TALIS|nr:meiotic recombination protein SPO11 [Talaromyces islandicus]